MAIDVNDSMAPATRVCGGLKGHHVLMAFVAFFGVIIAVNMTMFYFAAGSWTGLVVKNSYVASQDFDTTLARAQSQEALGLRDTFDLSGQVVTFGLVDSVNAPVDATDVHAIVGRPAFDNQDHRVDLNTVAAGVYTATTPLADGEWVATVNATLPDGSLWTMRYRFIVSGS